MFSRALSLWLAAGFCSLTAPDPCDSVRFETPEGRYVTTHRLTKEGFSYAKLRKLIEGNPKISDPLELLRYFRNTDEYKDVIRYYSLFAKTSALGQHSAAFPRIVLHKDNVYMGVRGNPKDPNSLIVEVMDCAPETGNCSFREIDFSKDKEERFREDLSKEPKTVDRKCGLCHGNDVHLEGDVERPLAHHPPHFPGAFGEDDDTIPKGSTYYQAFLDFQKKVKEGKDDDYERYRLLYPMATKLKKNGDLFLKDRPNRHLSSHLLQANNRRVAADLKAMPHADAYLFSTLGAVFDCADIESFLPDARGDAHRKKIETVSGGKGYYPATLPLSKFQTKDKAFMTALEEHTEELNLFTAAMLLKKSFPEDREAARKVDPSKGIYSTIAKFRFVTEGAGLKTRRWPISSWGHRNVYRFTQEGFDNLLQCGLGPRLLALGKNWEVFKGGKVSPATLEIPKKDFCEKLQAASLAAFEKIDEEAPKENAPIDRREPFLPEQPNHGFR